MAPFNPPPPHQLLNVCVDDLGTFTVKQGGLQTVLHNRATLGPPAVLMRGRGALKAVLHGEEGVGK